MAGPGRETSSRPPFAPITYRPTTPLYGPYIHQINKGGLEEIIKSQELIATPGRGGVDTAVRAVRGTLRPTPPGRRESIEFYTHERPSETHPTDVSWPRNEGARVAIILTRVARPGMELELLRVIESQPP